MHNGREVIEEGVASAASVNQFSATHSAGSAESELSSESFERRSPIQMGSVAATDYVGDVPQDTEGSAIEPESGGVEGSGEHDPAGVAWIDAPDGIHVEDGVCVGFGGGRWR